jgi:hypothetical protein
MGPTTYAGLKADILQMTDDQSDDMISNLDAIIGLGESKVLRDLDLEIFQDELNSGNLTVGSRNFTRPDGVLKIRDLYVVDPDTQKRKRVVRKTKSYCEAWAENQTDNELPTFYAEVSPSTLLFVNAPDKAYQVLTFGIVRPAGLSETNPTTWLSKNVPELLLYACLLSSEEYLTNPDQVKVWENRYTADQLPKAKIEFRGNARAEYQLSRQSSVANTPL